MSQAPSSPRSVVVVAVDRSDIGGAVLAFGVESARVRAGAELHIITVVDWAPQVGEGVAFALEHGRERAERLVEQAMASFTGPVFAHVTAGTPWREIVQIASDLDADLVVVGTHGATGLKRLVLGSVAEQVVRKSSCPVLVYRPKVDQGVPEIEPPCPACVEARQTSGGTQLYCQRHGERHHLNMHLHYRGPQALSGTAFLRT